MKRLLIADDDPGMRAALEARFAKRGWNVDLAVNGVEALAKFRPALHSLVITDVRMPGRDGFELMRGVQTSSPGTPVILLTAYACVPDAVKAMRHGACDYLVKPVSFEKLEATVEQLLRGAGMLNKEAARETEFLIGSSPAWQQALGRARQAALTDADVLIEAESGTGKELVARLIHRLSARKAGPFVAVNCAAFPETLLESELFGHARGAFTGAIDARPGKFEMASGGTLLLDEVGEMPLPLQPKLLRVLQEREFDRLGSNQTVRVDIRVVSTTNQSLAKAIAEGRFRADLFYRLNVIPISLPPLSERTGDVRELARHFTALYSEGGREVRLSEALLSRLEAQPWPGNVRELANFVRRAVALSAGGEIGLEAFEHGKTPTAPSPVAAPEWRAGVSLEEMERRLFSLTLDATGGNRARAAELLGVSLRTVRNKVREFGLPARSDYRRDYARE
ncbi:MAG: sigma-54-dependent transcriptional regulator [Terriglobales bacterium]